MNWIAALAQGLLRALLGWGQDNAEKPRPVEHAQTPPEKLKSHHDRVREYKLRKDADESRNNPPT